MGQYVQNVQLVEDIGRKIELRQTLAETSSQLADNEVVCAVANRVHGKAALVIRTDNDHHAVRSDQGSLVGVYAIPKSAVPSDD